jgi:hypothetical protein
MPRTAGGCEITICASKEWTCPTHFFFLPFSPSLPRIFFFLGPFLPGPRPVVLRGRGLPQEWCEVPVFASLGGQGARRNQWLIPHRSGGVG